jgi:hypothetical protein
MRIRKILIIAFGIILVVETIYFAHLLWKLRKIEAGKTNTQRRK